MANTSTDWRALCAELHAAFNTYAVGEEHHQLLVRAATALAQPEPEGLTDESTHKRRWPVHLSRRQREIEAQRLCSQAGIDGAQQRQLCRDARDGMPLQDIIELIDFTVEMRKESTIASELNGANPTKEEDFDD